MVYLADKQLAGVNDNHETHKNILFEVLAVQFFTNAYAIPDSDSNPDSDIDCDCDSEPESRDDKPVKQGVIPVQFIGVADILQDMTPVRLRQEGTIVKEKKVLIIFLTAILLTLLSVQCYRPGSRAGAVEVGQVAPPFALQDLTGREVSLQQYRGKIVIVDFWATWCGPCRMVMPMIDELQEEFSGEMVVLAVNLQETKDIISDYILEQNLHSKVLMDEDGAVGIRYGAVSIPMQFLIDQEGIVRYIVDRADPRLIAEMKARIEELLNGRIAV